MSSKGVLLSRNLNRVVLFLGDQKPKKIRDRERTCRTEVRPSGYRREKVAKMRQRGKSGGIMILSWVIHCSICYMLSVEGSRDQMWAYCWESGWGEKWDEGKAAGALPSPTLWLGAMRDGGNCLGGGLREEALGGC